jgi:hypothetical protein
VRATLEWGLLRLSAVLRVHQYDNKPDYCWCCTVFRAGIIFGRRTAVLKGILRAPTTNEWRACQVAGRRAGFTRFRFSRQDGRAREHNLYSQKER